MMAAHTTLVCCGLTLLLCITTAHSAHHAETASIKSSAGSMIEQPNRRLLATRTWVKLFGGQVIPTTTTAAPPPSPPPPSPPPPATTTTSTTTTFATTSLTTTSAPAPAPTPAPGIPLNPYVNVTEVCVPGVLVDATFPTTPFPLYPFTKPFVNPPKAKKTTTSCDLLRGYCMDGYNINIQEASLDLGVGCPAYKTGSLTRMATYNGTFPGPMFEVPVGRQTYVRYNNLISPQSSAYPPAAPCSTPAAKGGRPMGRPTSTHVHGMASLAPYDGYAEDEVCSGESKDHVYPNNRIATLHYHDHALDISAENVMGGLAGMYVVKQQTSVGTAPERWGLDTMQEYPLILTDRVMDSKCQFVFDRVNAHHEDFWGDINFVNGVPWPVASMEPKWVRFRALNSAVSRPWLLSLKDTAGTVYNNILNCQIIAGDGGYRQSPIPFPATGLYMGVAERYEFVCDMSKAKGKTLYLWNDQDLRRTDAPFFCNTHLVMKIDVGMDCLYDTGCLRAAKFQPPMTATLTDLEKVFYGNEKALATAYATSQKCHRSFYFQLDPVLGIWTINNQTWHSMRVAAGDVGSNSWEVWCLEASPTDGDHPIHIHLVDAFILYRYPQGNYQVLESFEKDVPKDVVVLHPGTKVAIMARWGPHRGEYMFHCHNLRHEDNSMMRTFSTNNTISSNLGGQSTNTLKLSTLTFNSITGKLYDTYNNPLLVNTAAKPTNQMPALNNFLLSSTLSKDIYRIFYPGFDDRAQMCDPYINPWLVNTCKTTWTGKRLH